MADPLSIVAGILAVIGAAGKTYQGLQSVWALRYIDEEFLGLLNEVTGLRTQLQAVEASLQKPSIKELDNVLTGDCIRNIASLSVEAKEVLAEIDEFVRDVECKKDEKQRRVDKKLSKGKWMRRKSALIRLTKKVSPIVHSLTAAASILRAIASDQRLSKMNDMLTILTIQNIELLQKPANNTTTVGDEVSLETKLDLAITQAIEADAPNKGQHTSNTRHHEGKSRRSSIDSFHSALSSSSDSAESIVSITGSSGALKCEQFCPCQCHINSQIRTPLWVKQIFGTMTFHGNGSILLNRRTCNKSCHRSGLASIQFSYLAPAWTLLKALNVIVKAQSIHGLDFNIRMPRVIPYNATVWSVIELGKLSNLQDMVSRNAISPYDVNPSGRSLLSYAATKGQNEIYRYLIFLKADPYLRDASGMAANQAGVDRALSGTALKRNVSNTARAATYDLFTDTDTLDQQEFNFLHLIVLGLRHLNLEMVLAQCLSPQCDIDTPDVNGRTPLIWAAWRGDVKTIALLLTSRADINKTDHEGHSALAKAVKSGHLDCVRKLLEAGASFKTGNDHGLQPIHWASSNKLNGSTIVDELLSWGANPNAHSTSGTPLHFAANRGFLDTVKRLVRGGANIDAQDSDGDSPAMVALLCWNQSVFSHLMHTGARLDLVRKTGENILHLVTWSGSSEIWRDMANTVSSDQVSRIDITALHNGHGLRHCFDTCRDLWYVGERESKAEEEMKFRRLIKAFKYRHVC